MGIELRKVKLRNQVTLPKVMVKDLDIKEGDQVVFRKLDAGSYIISKVDEKKFNSILMIDHRDEYKVNQNKS